MTSGHHRAAPDLPQDLMASAVVLANESAWLADDALKVIDYLSRNGLAVVGVELWEAVDARPKWLASSDYQCGEFGNTQRYIECCGAGARQFIGRWESEGDVLFNLTWSDPG